MTDTTNLGLPCIEAAQAQKHVTRNDALRIFDALVQIAVVDRDLSTPPPLAEEGQRWIVAAGGTDAWSGRDNAIAAWQDGGWQFYAPKPGWLAYVVDEGVLLVWNGAVWSDVLSTVAALQNLSLFGIGTTADAANPLSAKLNNALFIARAVAEGGDGTLRYKLSKESADKTLSFLFQDNFSGRAEFGLTGDDNFHFKVSPDGAGWKTALTIEAASGTLAAPFGLAGGDWGEPVASWGHSGNVSEVVFTNLGVYRELQIVGFGLQHNSASSQSFQAQLSSDNGATWIGAGGTYDRYGTSNGSSAVFTIGSDTFAAGLDIGMMVNLYDFNVPIRPAYGIGMMLASASSLLSSPVMARRTGAEANNAIRIYVSGDGQFVAGSILVFGKT